MVLKCCSQSAESSGVSIRLGLLAEAEYSCGYRSQSVARKINCQLRIDQKLGESYVWDRRVEQNGCYTHSGGGDSG